MTQGSATSIAPFNAVPQASKRAAGQALYSKSPTVVGTTPGGVKNFTGDPGAGDNVRNLGAKTFYRKDNRWIDSTVKPEEDAKATVVEQFSEEFFKIARDQTAEQNQYLTFEEPVTVAINGRVYRIEPPKVTK